MYTLFEVVVLKQFFSKRLFLFCSVFTINWWEASIQSTRTSLVCCDRDKVNNMNSWSRNSILLKMIWTRKAKVGEIQKISSSILYDQVLSLFIMLFSTKIKFVLHGQNGQNSNTIYWLEVWRTELYQLWDFVDWYYKSPSSELIDDKII